MITYNRLEYTKRTLDYLLDTIKVPHYIIVVDNHSTDGTKLWLAEQKSSGRIDRIVLNQQNYYPGRATNSGWAIGAFKYPKATHFMRLDNDFVFLPGWDAAVEKAFDKIPTLGQVGLDYSAIDTPLADGYEFTLNGITLNKFPGNVGGTSVIHRRVWDTGLRYDERPWEKNGVGIHTIQEDYRFSRDVINSGLLVGHLTEKVAYTFADESNWLDYPEYYKKTMFERGYDDLLDKL
jgi:glycosyltransferase involved in cell wall biosynthesis